MSRLDGKIALITGGSRGIGFAAAKAMTDAGATVIITGRSEEKGSAAENEISDGGGHISFFCHDACSPDDWSRLMDYVTSTYGGLHILVNNAGSFLYKAFIECSLDDFDQLFNLNVRGVFMGMQYAVPIMRETVKTGDAGSIINISSNASVRPFSHQSIYNSTKGAVDLLSRGLAREFGELGYNIRVNTVNPGIVYTDMAEKQYDKWIKEGLFKDRTEMEKNLIAEYPLGRLANPEEVARLILFLASDDAAFITGTASLIDGGKAI
jgi:3alpha(or 20beta)-hydroxysteroid dehydrogenase